MDLLWLMALFMIHLLSVSKSVVRQYIMLNESVLPHVS